MDDLDVYTKYPMTEHHRPFHLGRLDLTSIRCYWFLPLENYMDFIK